MGHDTIEESIHSYDRGTPLAEASTIPSLWYTEADIQRRERECVFGANWIYAGRTDLVKNPGDFFTIEIAGDPVLVTRDKCNQLHAMVNICRHRAARVECRSHGNARHLRCRYHGWAYDLAGNLAGTPEFDGVANPPTGGLPKLHVETFGPLIFVHFAPDPPSLKEYLAPLPEREEIAQINDLKFGGSHSYVMDCNWKIFIDNYLDGGYHIPTLHPGLAQVVRMETYKTTLFTNANLQKCPLKPSRNESLTKTRSGEFAYYWWIYPNFMINLYDGVMDTNWVTPLSPDKCLCVFDFYFKDIDSPDAKAFIENSLKVADQVQKEDMDICTEVQKGLTSRFYDTGRYSVRREAGGQHFHNLLARDLRKSL